MTFEIESTACTLPEWISPSTLYVGGITKNDKYCVFINRSKHMFAFTHTALIWKTWVQLAGKSVYTYLERDQWLAWKKNKLFWCSTALSACFIITVIVSTDACTYRLYYPLTHFEEEESAIKYHCAYKPVQDLIHKTVT